MKKLSLILFTLFITLSAYAQKKANYKVFPFKTGIIEYEKTGKTKGTHIKYIDDYGYKQGDYEETVTKIFGMKSKDKNGTVLIGPTVYAIDYKNNTVNKGKNPVYETYANSNGDYDKLGKEAMTALGFSDTGKTGTVLGNKCEIWKGNLGEIWIWKGLALKSVTKILGIKMEETATKISLDVKVPQDKFEVPKNMKVIKNHVPEGMEGGLKGLFGGQK
ncbi:MAG: hypothetical protein DSY82_00485 [Flavobacteriia bacterium]|nr:MAG: hypothetical protein DSY82_00485 [Flavobacteriia bacterium]